MREKKRGRGRFIWGLSAVAFVSALLLYWEQTALLYLLSTLVMCGLLLVVAFSDLEGRDKALRESTLNEKSATAGDGEMTAAPAPNRVRRVTKQKHQDAA